jgi:hypothetical protein
MIILVVRIWKPDIGNVLRWFLKLQPGFSTAYALIMIVMSGPLFNFGNGSVFSFEIAGGDFMFLVFDTIIYWVLIFLIENNFFMKRRAHAIREFEIEEQDDDV